MLDLENGKYVDEDLGGIEENERSRDISNDIGKENINKNADRGDEYGTVKKYKCSIFTIKLRRKIFIMKYTIKVNELKKESNIKAMATVVFGDSFKVGNIAVVERKDGELLVAMPHFRSNSRDKNGHDVYKSVCNPITKEFREVLYGEVIGSYNVAKDKNVLKSEDEFMAWGDTELLTMDKGSR